MTTAELLRLMQSTLIADSALGAWCQAELGRAPTIWLGIDEQNPPPEDDYPLVAIVGVDQLRGGARAEIQWQVHLGAGVVNPEITTNLNARSYSGLMQAETLRELAENALYRARLPAVNIESTGEASSVGYHPLYVSYTTVIVSALRSLRKPLP